MSQYLDHHPPMSDEHQKIICNSCGKEIYKSASVGRLCKMCRERLKDGVYIPSSKNKEEQKDG